MSWLSLIAELGININPFTRGLNRARAEASQAADKIGGDLKKKLWGAFGTGAVVAGMKSLFGDTKQIEQLAFQFEKSTTEIQAMQYAADKTGLSFGDILEIMNGTSQTALPHMKDRVGELIEEFNRLGIAIDENAIKKMNAAAANTDTAFGKLKQYASNGLGAGINFVEKISQLLGAYSVSGQGMSVTEFLKSGKAKEALATPETPKAEKILPSRGALDYASYLARITAQKKDHDPLPRLRGDSLAAVGGFVGRAAANPAMEIAKQQLVVQKKIEENTASKGGLGAAVRF